MMHPNIVRLYGVMTGMHMCRSAGISVSLLYRCTSVTMANTGVLALMVTSDHDLELIGLRVH